MALRQLEKTYEPRQVEERWYQFWISKGYFHATVEAGGTPYSIVIPPPNITGSLHVGHALNNSLQDILIRWRRMQGRNTLWMPGTDHAGIATQNVVERQLKEEGFSREELGRERFIERVQQWKARYGNTIVEQLKRLGASCDWSRLRFTMDEGLSKAVREVFVRLHEEGLIYRGERLINWCPRCLTALSDIEVEHEETKGKLYHIAYPLADDSETRLTVATTRPETMLGDTAVAVHPEDPRYNRLIGKHVTVPLTHRKIPIIGDSILVDRELGTGAVKITPAHDFNDFEAGLRHNLPRLAIFDEQAHLSPLGLSEAKVEQDVRGRLALKPVKEARAIVVDLLRERGALIKVEDHKMALGKCYRCKTVVEPYLSPQWFVKIKPLAEPAIKAVEDGSIRLIPESWANNYLGWMRDIKDWCISRQIWWGHQIPAWYCRKCHDTELTAGTPDEKWRPPRDAQPLVGRTQPTQCPKCHNTELIRDPDVLDTWFSSALWPFSTLGWPEQTPELKVFYPTSTLVTGLDILFFWVARMIMMGLHFTGQVPFREVYIHALVRDAEGKKMSKSKGNVIDPLHVMEEYGTDALRFTLASLSTPGRDVKLVREKDTGRAPQIEGYRNFANKIWNAARFILMHLDGPREEAPAAARSFADRWILSRLNKTIRSVNTLLEQYRFDLASQRLYQFIWHEYCDWYLEMVKPTLQDKDSDESKTTRQTLLDSFETTLRLLHPFMPFITEEIWQSIPHKGESIVIQQYPTSVSEWDMEDAETQFGVLEKLVILARAERDLFNYPPGKTVELFVISNDEEQYATISNLKRLLEHLSRGSVHFPQNTGSNASGTLPPNVFGLINEGVGIGILVESMEDLQKASDRIKKQRDEKTEELSRTESKLSNPEFAAKAPPEVVDEHKQRLETLRQEQKWLASCAEQVRTMMGGR